MWTTGRRKDGQIAIQPRYTTLWRAEPSGANTPHLDSFAVSGKRLSCEHHQYCLCSYVSGHSRCEIRTACVCARHGPRNIAKIIELLECVLPQQAVLKEFEMTHDFKFNGAQASHESAPGIAADVVPIKLEKRLEVTRQHINRDNSVEIIIWFRYLRRWFVVGGREEVASFANSPKARLTIIEILVILARHSRQT